jgi:hypothetical protein
MQCGALVGFNCHTYNYIYIFSTNTFVTQFAIMMDLVSFDISLLLP